MRHAVLSASVLCAMAAASSYAQAQPVSGQRLDELSRQRSSLPTSRPEIAPLPAQPETLAPNQQAWRCMSIDEWKDVLAEPRRGAPAIGKTQAQIAVSADAAVNGYRKILFYNGQTGFVQANQLRPYRSDINPGQGCTVKGMRPDTGGPVFSYQAPTPR